MKQRTTLPFPAQDASPEETKVRQLSDEEMLEHLIIVTCQQALTCGVKFKDVVRRMEEITNQLKREAEDALPPPTPANRQQSSGSVYDAVKDQLGGGTLVDSRHHWYRLHDGRLVEMHDRSEQKSNIYSYSIEPSTYDNAKSAGCKHFIFIMGNDGFVTLTVRELDRHINAPTISTKKKPGGEIQHYHVAFTPPPDVKLKGYHGADDLRGPSYCPHRMPALVRAIRGGRQS